MELTVRYYAGAGAAAGVTEERLPRPDTVAELTAVLVQRHPSLEPILQASSLLLDGVVANSAEAALTDITEVDVLPPFAGG